MNIFKKLGKYGSREEENYLTESFVYTLHLLCDRAPSLGLDVLEKLLGLSFEQVLKSPAPPEFITQEKVEDGFPDVTIRFGTDLLAYIEIKHDAPLHEGQLEYYKRMLSQSDADTQSLVLLTRSKQNANETTLPDDEYHHVCWYEVHSWLRECLGSDEVVDHVIHEFLEFLEEKKMSHQKVGWEYDNGVNALVDLTTMMEAAVDVVFKEKMLKKTAGWSWRGFYLDNQYFFGVRFDKQTTVVFEDKVGTNPDFKKDFSFDGEHFFSLDAGAQFESLVKFLNQCKEELV
jgi:hypothetical protein